MFTTRDYLKLSPWDALIQMVNDQRYLQLDAKTTSLTRFTVLTPMTVEVVLETQRSSDEANILPAVPPQVVRLQRLDLATFFRQTEAFDVTGLPLPVNTQTIVRQLGERNAIAFDLDDFDHFNIEQLTDDTYTLAATPYSLRWTGQLTFRLTTPPTLDLGSATVVELPDAFIYPNADTTKTQGWFYLMPYDFTAYRQDLLNLGNGSYSLSGDYLARILTHVTGESWQCHTTPGPHNLCAAVVDDEPRYQVEYNGPTLPRFTPKTGYQRLLVLRLGADYCTDIGGHLLLHYN